jgi:hypothetical protein
MVRALAYGLTGSLVGIVGAFFVAVMANLSILSMPTALGLGGCVGCAFGLLLALKLSRLKTLQGPFLAKKDMPLLEFLTYQELIGFLPLGLTNRIVARLRAYLEKRL